MVSFISYNFKGVVILIIKALKIKSFCYVFIILSVALGFAIKNPAVIKTSDSKKDFIKWVDFKVTENALSDCYNAEISAYKDGKKLDWIECLAYLGARYGGDFSRYKKADLTEFTEKILKGEKAEKICSDLKYYNYYKEAYSAVLGGFVGKYEIETINENNLRKINKKYGLKAFSPIALGYYYSHYNDFGSSRSYGYKRKHLGHDLMGSVGTPIVAVESGTVEALGWNRYGGWRIGIRSFDKKRYYYYAHLRRDHPYSDEIYEGKTVTAGDVIGYLGMTGYSIKENVNNIDIPHLHYGMQLIFDESQKEGNGEIWIDMYAITNFLEKNKSAVEKNYQNGEFYRKFQMFEEMTKE